MKKWLIVGIAILAYVALAAWGVHDEGKRDALIAQYNAATDRCLSVGDAGACHRRGGIERQLEDEYRLCRYDDSFVRCSRTDRDALKCDGNGSNIDPATGIAVAC